MNIPGQITVGDSKSWTDPATFDDAGNSLQSSKYALSYNLVGPTKLKLDAVPYGDGWQTILSTTASASLMAGVYAWVAYISAAEYRYTAGTGTLTVTADLGAVDVSSAAYDPRTQNEKNLAAIESTIQARINGGAVLDYQIGTRNIKKESLTVLLQLRDYYTNEVAKERRLQRKAQGLGDPRTMYIRFR